MGGLPRNKGGIKMFVGGTGTFLPGILRGTTVYLSCFRCLARRLVNNKLSRTAAAASLCLLCESIVYFALKSRRKDEPQVARGHDLAVFAAKQLVAPSAKGQEQTLNYPNEDTVYLSRFRSLAGTCRLVISANAALYRPPSHFCSLSALCF